MAGRDAEIDHVFVTITLLAPLAATNSVSPCHWVPARRSLIASREGSAGISRDQQAIGVNRHSCRQRRRVCPAKSRANAFKGAGGGHVPCQCYM